MLVKVIKETWLPAQTALVEVDSPGDGLLVCTAQRVDVWPRKLTKGVNKVRCQIREERAPITLHPGEVIGEVMNFGGESNADNPEPARSVGGAGKRKARADGDK